MGLRDDASRDLMSQTASLWSRPRTWPGGVAIWRRHASPPPKPLHHSWNQRISEEDANWISGGATSFVHVPYLLRLSEAATLAGQPDGRANPQTQR